MNTFETFKIKDFLINNLTKQGIKSPTPIQSETIPKVLENKDLLASAQTGTGKTLAFLLPMFNNFDSNYGHIEGLIVTPTRELALQITKEAEKLAKDTNINVLAIYGGRDINSQLRKLKNNVNFIVATPGRLIDHIEKNTINLRHLKTIVLDEADQMLLIGFKNEIDIILRNTNKNKQMLCFSATLDSKVKKLAYKYMNNPLEISAKKESITLETINQKVITSSDRWKTEALLKELDKSNPFLGIIFCRTKRRVDKLEEEMSIKKYSCKKLHGDMKQNLRQRIMKEFRNAKFQYLIATDVASRGLDITGITHIYNFDTPETPEIYIHRIGRTGRMGKDGVAVTFVAPKDELLLSEIEKTIKIKLPREEYIKVK
ncbi:DEAD/DEAH box helicase [Helicovermis profundi]|uniref:DEAD/DEAH box helicase n=1 Tax=Helicovermis profundi TaxID=3065157 RepID=A0AAU9EXT4_9FIRM|nr:DEAD/DEAH box helicase [Clostridia bacterium S502]